VPIDVSCRQVFLASPGSLKPERRICRKVFRQHNESRAVEVRTFFYVHAWEDVPGGVGRPQDLINPNLDECDYVVILFNDRWGSPPAHAGRFSSGTEEEFYRALELLADVNREMRDILVLFKTIDANRLRDSGPELQKVLDFRAALEKSKSLMYQAFDSEEALKRILEQKMHAWLKDNGPKRPRRIEIPEARVDTSGLQTRNREELLESARAFAADGLLVQAEAAFAGATEDGAPEDMLEFGQFMRRTGRLQKAMELNRKVVEDPNLLTARGADATSLRVRAMSNIGVIQRHLGELSRSIQTLREAVRTAESARDPISQQLCYALDNYGHSLLRAGQIEAARQQFERADGIRAVSGTIDERTQSAINLGRFHLGQSQYDAALGYFIQALNLLGAESDQHLRANALAGQAEALIRLGHNDEVDDLLTTACETNESLHNKKGLGIVHGLWARSLLQQDRPEDADPHIAIARELVDETGDVQGRAVVAFLRAESARRHGQTANARALAVEAQRAVSEVSDAALHRDLDALVGALQPI
jgi:tetratricopeptide (TPR) repeat protein